MDENTPDDAGPDLPSTEHASGTPEWRREVHVRYRARRRGEDVPLRFTNGQMYPAFFVPEMKRCARCKEEKAEDAFPRIRGGKYLHSYCKPCCSAISREQYQKNREELAAKAKAKYCPVAAAEMRRERLRRDPQFTKRAALRKYGLSLSQYDDLLKSQDYGCAICGEPNDDGFALAVDHCHVTGTVRGLLCRKCNVGIGLMRDDVRILRAVIDYLTEPPAPGVLNGG